MLKNTLATIGLWLVIRKGYAWHLEYQFLKAKVAQPPHHDDTPDKGA